MSTHKNRLFLILVIMLWFSACSDDIIEGEGSFSIEVFDIVTREPILADLTVILENDANGRSVLKETNTGTAVFSQQRTDIYNLRIPENRSYEGLTRRGIRILPGEQTELRVFLEPFVLPDIGSVSGVILNSATDETVETTTTVYLIRDDSEILDSTEVNSGRYSFERVPIGRYNIRVPELCAYDPFVSNSIVVEKDITLNFNLLLVPQERFFREIRLLKFPERKVDGTTWDLFFIEPDIFIRSDRLGDFRTFQNARQNQLPLIWAFESFQVRATNERWVFRLLDADSPDPDDPMIDLVLLPGSNEGVECEEGNTISFRVSNDDYSFEIIYDVID